MGNIVKGREIMRVVRDRRRRVFQVRAMRWS